MDEQLTQEDLTTLANFYKQKAENLEIQFALLQGRLKRVEQKLVETSEDTSSEE